MLYLKHMRGGLFSSGRIPRSLRYVRSWLIMPRSGGFTIIEVLIVMGITAALFLSAALLIGGRQNQAAFDQAIRQVQSQVQQVMNEVGAGYAPNTGAYQCTATGSGPTLASGAATQGTNSGCIFLGRVMQFRVSSTNPEQFVSYSIAGLKQGGAGGNESSSLSEAKPVLVAPGITHQTAGYPNTGVAESLQNGLSTVRMWYNNGGADVEIGAVAFVSSMAQYSGSNIVSGAGQVNVVPLNGTALNTSRAAVVETANSDGSNALVTSPLNPSNGVHICFTSGNTRQYGIVNIGGNGRDLAVTLTIKDNTGAACS
jgi:type II secretory pathway pseudopilin PulG